MTRKKKQPINNLVVVSDEHINCRLGLCPPEKIPLDDGGYYLASELQQKVWGYWRTFWDDFVPRITHGEPFAVVNNGDAIDGGEHHGNTTHISANLGDQERVAEMVFAPIVKRCEGRFYMIRGTEAHGGKSCVDEERLARKLDAIPDRYGRYARWEMKARVGRGLVHLAHHIGNTGSMAYETTAPHKELEQALVEAARWCKEIPNVVVRSHRHRSTETRIQTYKGLAISAVTAGWQLKTPFTYRIPGARQTRPQFGGMVVRCGDEDVYTRHWYESIDDVEEVAL